MPKISVVTVAFNSERTIEDTILSVRSQKDADCEHIIVDGGSRDGTMAIVDRHRHHLGAVISEPDKGIYDAMNKGVALARGEYLGCLNSDDYFASDHALARIQAAFEAEGGADCVWGNIVYVDASGRPRRIVDASWFRPSLFKFAIMPPHPGFYARTDAIRAAGGFEPKYKIAGDFDLMVRLFQDPSFRGKHIDELVTVMRLGGVSTEGIAVSRFSSSELLDALTRNGISSRPWMVNVRYLLKTIEMLRGSLLYARGKTYPPRRAAEG
jgi:glycosyltransferase involved in cell wall biosynthesis